MVIENEVNKVEVLESCPEDPLQEAEAALALGKRNLLVSDIPLAITSLAKACELFNKVYDEHSVECTEAYYCYGKALLEMARLDNQVLGNGLDTATDENSVEPEEECQKNNFEEDGAKSTDDPTETNDESEDEGVEYDEEEPSNLELAWEMLELAKVVCTKALESSKNSEVSHRLCDIYMLLGEISLENENYLQAVEDLSSCLATCIANESEDSRYLAETYYQLGVAQSFDMKWDEAVVNLEAAIKVLEKRSMNLKNKVNENPGAKDDNNEKEILDLDSLIPDIKEKITDTKEMKIAMDFLPLLDLSLYFNLRYWFYFLWAGRIRRFKRT
jgi:nuclear autoantigenic sperm protein